MHAVQTCMLQESTNACKDLGDIESAINAFAFPFLQQSTDSRCDAISLPAQECYMQNARPAGAAKRACKASGALQAPQQASAVLQLAA